MPGRVHARRKQMRQTGEGREGRAGRREDSRKEMGWEVQEMLDWGRQEGQEGVWWG